MSKQAVDFSALLKRCITPGSPVNATNFPDLPHALSLLRTMVAVVVALIVTSTGITGGNGLVIGLICILLAGVGFVKVWLKADDASYDAGGAGAGGGILFSGMMPAIAAYIFSWAVFYTLSGAVLPAPASSGSSA